MNYGRQTPPNYKGVFQEMPKEPKKIPAFLIKIIKDFSERLLYIYKLVWDTNPAILFGMLFISLSEGLLPVIKAFVLAEIINELVAGFGTGAAAISSIFNLFIIQFICIFAGKIIANFNTVLTRTSGEMVANHIKLKIMNKVKEIDLASFDIPEFYEKLENANREAGTRPLHVLTATFSAMSKIITIVSFIAILAALSPWAPTVIILLSFPTALVNFIFKRKNVNYMRRRSKDRRQLNYYSSKMTDKNVVKEMRIFGLSDVFIKKYSEVFKKYFAGLKKLFFSESLWHTGTGIISAAANCILFVYIAANVLEGNLEVGDYSLHTGALNSISSGIASLISTTATVYEGTLFIDNMISFMKEKKNISAYVDPPAKLYRNNGHRIVFENVSFAYPGTDRKVLENINLTIENGETLVLVGLNGAGKTTLIKLLTRLYDPTEGTIYIDGIDMKNYCPEDIYKIFGIIFQDYGKYAVTVKENIVFGDIFKEVDDEAVKHAAEQSNADYIDKLPNGFNTPLTRIFEEDGIELSGGQWQKLAIARAFYSDSDILIFDEPTASLDPLAEQEIYNQFDTLRKDKTTIFVSHRLSSATTATKIVVLEQGRLIEEGTHLELMQKKGRYHQMFTLQAERYITPENNRLPSDN